MFREVAEAYDPADLPDDETWKNDLDAIADGMFENPPKSAADMSEAQRRITLNELNADMAGER